MEYIGLGLGWLINDQSNEMKENQHSHNEIRLFSLILLHHSQVTCSVYMEHSAFRNDIPQTTITITAIARYLYMKLYGEYCECNNTDF
jgi:hypothetical protein